MELKKTGLDEFRLFLLKGCFYLTIISTLVIYFAQPMQITILEALSSRCFLLSNLFAFLIVISHCFQNYIPYKTHQVVMIIFMIGGSFLSYLSGTSGLYDYIIRLLCYLALPFYFLYLDYIKPDKVMINTIFIVHVLMSLVFAFHSISDYRYRGYEGYIGTNRAWLTLGYDNPNQAAMYLLITMIVLLAGVFYYKNFFLRVILVLPMLYLGYLLQATSSRTCIFIFLWVLFMLVLKKWIRLNHIFVGVLILLPALFMVLYPVIYESNWFTFFEIAGKSDYSSRSDIYQAVFESVSNRILLGDFSAYELQNLHNGTLSIYASLGILGLLSFYIYIFRAYFHLLTYNLKSKTAYLGMIGLLAVFLHACTESAFLIGGSMFAGSLSVLILLIKIKREDVN